MLNSVEHEISNAQKDKNIMKFSFFLGSYKPRMLFFLLINVKMPTIVGILTFISRKSFMLSRVEHEKSFITSGPWYTSVLLHYGTLPHFYAFSIIFGKGFSDLQARGYKKIFMFNSSEYGTFPAHKC